MTTFARAFAAGRCCALALVLCVFAGSRAEAESPWANLADPVFARIDTRELPNPVIQALEQDPSGLMWVGTAAGLASFDGYHFRSFLPDTRGLASHAAPDILKLASDARGGLWLGTASSGLMHFDPASERFSAWPTDAAGRSGPRSATIWALARNDKRLWIGGDGGLDTFDPSDERFARIDLGAPGVQPEVRSLFVDRTGTLWIGTDRGLFYHRASDATNVRPFAVNVAGVDAGRQQIWSIYEDSSGRLWLGSRDSVVVLDRNRAPIAAFRSSPDVASLAPGLQRSITEAVPGVFWVGSSEGGVSIVDLNARRVRRIAGNQSGAGELSADVVWQWLRDRAGSIWVAGYNGGLLLHDPSARGVYTLPADRPETGLNTTQARAVAPAPRGLWVAGLDGSLIELDPNRGRVVASHVPKVPTALAAAIDGSLWIGTQQGLCALRDGAVACPAGPREVGTSWVMAVLDTDRTLWVGTQTGLVAQDKSNGTTVVYRHGTARTTISNIFTTALLLDRKGRLWVGTVAGLDRIDPRSGKVVSIPLARGSTLEPGFVESLAEDASGRIWAGRYGVPSVVLQEGTDGRFTVRRFGRAEGLPESVDALAVDPQGRIWASMDNPGNGIALIDPASLRVRTLGLADGVSIDQYAVGAATRTPDGTIFFGGLKGVTAIAPQASLGRSDAPPLIVTALALGRHSVPAWGVNRSDATVELAPGARDITVEFAALDYAAPQSVRYAYKLDGYDRDWIPADSAHRIATYTNLPPGQYTLHVRGTNRLGGWSGRTLQLGVTALPAWYETWWFRALLVLLAAAALYGLHVTRTELLRRRQRELEGIVRERTSELRQANAKLEEMSLTDPLTGLRNRRFLTQHIEADVAIALRRYEDALANSAAPPSDAALLFFLVDIDHFKAVNDELGHRAGDLVLMQMRERLQEVFRESDIVVRWGGEEFLAVAHGGWSDAVDIAERLRAAVAGRPFVLDGGATLSKTASVGFAAFPFVAAAPRALAWTQVVELADQGLYMAKNGGRNTWFGLAATARTNPDLLERQLAVSAEEAVRAGQLEIIHPQTVKPA